MKGLAALSLVAVALAGLAAGAHPLPSGWSTRAPMPVGREGAAGAFIDGKFYVSHGYSSADGTDNAVYDPVADTWAPLAPATVPRSELAGAAVGGKLYAIGGRDPTGFCPTSVCDVVEIYDVATDSWSFGAPMPTPRAGLGLAVVADKIYAVGGRDGAIPGSGSPLAALEIYDPATDSWSAGPPMPTPRMDVYSTTVLDGKVWVIGGFDPAVGDLATVEIFDPATGTWSAGPPVPTARSNAIAGVCDGHIFMIGGTIGFSNTDVVEQFEPATGTWEPAPPMPMPGSEIASTGVSGPGLIMATGSGIFGEGLGQNFALECGKVPPPPPPPPPLVMTGRATVATATVEDPAGLTGPTAVTVVDTGEVESESASTEEDVAVTLSGPVSGNALKARVETEVGISSAEALVAEALVAVPLAPTVEVSSLRAWSEAACGGAFGKTSLAFLAVGGFVIVDGLLTPPPNTEIPLPTGGSVILNEQIPVADADFGLTVNAVHVIVPGVADVVVASARTDVHNCPES